MPHFTLYYKTPESLCTDTEEERFRLRVSQMAEAVQTTISRLFLGNNVSFFALETPSINGNMPDFYVEASVNDKYDSLGELIKKGQSIVIETMREFAFQNESVGCWFRRVKGAWGNANGLKPVH